MTMTNKERVELKDKLASKEAQSVYEKKHEIFIAEMDRR